MEKGLVTLLGKGKYTFSEPGAHNTKGIIDGQQKMGEGSGEALGDKL